MCLAILWYGTPFFLQGFRSGEMSSNAGGLIRWPVYLMMPLGFGLLMLQGLSELIKRVAFLKGLIADPTAKKIEKDRRRRTRRSHPPPRRARRQGLNAKTRSTTMEFFIANLAPIMFAGLIVFLLFGFPVAFSLGACGLFFGFIGIELDVLPARCCRPCRCASSASCRTTRCWRFRSSP